MSDDSGPVKFIQVRWENGSWQTVGTPQKPLRLRTPSGGWQLFGNGPGKPLRLRMPDNSWQIITHAGGGLPPGRNLVPYGWNPDSSNYGAPLLSGWNTQRKDFTRDNGDAGVVYDNNINRPTAAWLSAYARSATGDSNTYTVYQERSVDLCYAWYVVPMGIFKTDALRFMSEIYNQMRYPNAMLFEVGVDMYLTGRSMLSSRMPFYPGYGDPQYLIGLTEGTGTIWYQGHSAQSEGPVHWESPYNHLVSTDLVYDLDSVPVVRNKLLVKESGIQLWHDSLNTLGMQNWMDMQSAVKVTHKLGVNVDGGLQYHFYCSDTPPPPPLQAYGNPAPPKVWDNSFSVMFVPWFNFAFDIE